MDPGLMNQRIGRLIAASVLSLPISSFQLPFSPLSRTDRLVQKPTLTFLLPPSPSRATSEKHVHGSNGGSHYGGGGSLYFDLWELDSTEDEPVAAGGVGTGHELRRRQQKQQQRQQGLREGKPKLQKNPKPVALSKLSAEALGETSQLDAEFEALMAGRTVPEDEVLPPSMNTTSVISDDAELNALLQARILSIEKKYENRRELMLKSLEKDQAIDPDSVYENTQTIVSDLLQEQKEEEIEECKIEMVKEQKRKRIDSMMEQREVNTGPTPAGEANDFAAKKDKRLSPVDAYFAEERQKLRQQIRRSMMEKSEDGNVDEAEVLKRFEEWNKFMAVQKRRLFERRTEEARIDAAVREKQKDVASLSVDDSVAEINRYSLLALEGLLEKQKAVDGIDTSRLEKRIARLKKSLESVNYVDVDLAEQKQEDDDKEIDPEQPVDLSDIFPRHSHRFEQKALKGESILQQKSDKVERKPKKNSVKGRKEEPKVVASDSLSVGNHDLDSDIIPQDASLFYQDDAEEQQLAPPDTPFFQDYYEDPSGDHITKDSVSRDESKHDRSVVPEYTGTSDIDAPPEQRGTSLLGSFEEQKMQNYFRQRGAWTKEEQDRIRRERGEFQRKQEERMKRFQEAESEDLDVEYDISDMLTEDGDVDVEKLMSYVKSKTPITKADRANDAKEEAALADSVSSGDTDLSFTPPVEGDTDDELSRKEPRAELDSKDSAGKMEASLAETSVVSAPVVADSDDSQSTENSLELPPMEARFEVELAEDDMNLAESLQSRREQLRRLSGAENQVSAIDDEEEDFDGESIDLEGKTKVDEVLRGLPTKRRSEEEDDDDQSYRYRNDLAAYEARKAECLRRNELNVMTVDSLMDLKESAEVVEANRHIPRINRAFKEFGAVFRLEGVLVDIAGLESRVWRRVAEIYGFSPPSFDDVRRATLQKAEYAPERIFDWSKDTSVCRRIAITHDQIFKEELGASLATYDIDGVEDVKPRWPDEIGYLGFDLEYLDDVANTAALPKEEESPDVPGPEAEPRRPDGYLGFDLEFLGDGADTAVQTGGSSLKGSRLEDLALTEGAMNWVQSLIDVEMPVGLVSYLDGDSVDIILDRTGLKELFSADRIVTKDSGYARDSWQQLGAVVRIDRRPDMCVLFDGNGDALLSARENGMKSVGMTNIYPSFELLASDTAARDFSFLTAMNVRRIFGDRDNQEPLIEDVVVAPVIRKKVMTMEREKDYDDDDDDENANNDDRYEHYG